MTPIRKWLAVLGAAMGTMAMGLSFSLINTNLETIHQDFGASLVQLQWMINIYGIFIASLLVTMGRLGDIFGRKKIYLIGNLLFGIAMLGAGLATSPAMIIGFQALYGISGAILLPLSQAMLVDIFPE
nr:Antiseptic resistance protein [Chlamydiota bacterium]